MSNTLALAKRYMDALDEVYKLASLTADLDGDTSDIRDGANAEEFVIPKMTLQGLATYAGSFVSGDISLAWETVKANFSRGRGFNVDAVDNGDTGINMISKVLAAFEREKVVPEVDAFRFASYAALSGTSPAGATLSDAAATVAALRVAVTALDEAEVPEGSAILYITSLLRGYVEDMDTTKSRELLKKFKKIVTVPQSRFYTKIDQYDGTTAGQEDGGYIKNVATGKDINFLIVDPKSVLQIQKHKVAKLFNPEDNQSADAWKLNYRLVNLSDVYDNKTKGIYLHKKA